MEGVHELFLQTSPVFLCILRHKMYRPQLSLLTQSTTIAYAYEVYIRSLLPPESQADLLANQPAHF
jgi:hypothetical protein